MKFLRILTALLCAVCPVVSGSPHLRATQQDASGPFYGSWLQVYSNFYVQSTSEVDYHCVQVDVQPVNHSITKLSITKSAYQHGNINQPVRWTQLYNVTWLDTTDKEAEDNMVLVPLLSGSSVVIPLWLRRRDPDYIIWTGMDNKTLFVWAHEPSQQYNPEVLHDLVELDFRGTYKTPVSSYSLSCLN